MNLSLSTKPLSQIQTDVVVSLLAEDQNFWPEQELDKFLGKTIARLRETKDFTGESGKTRLVFRETNFPRLLLVGLGRKKNLTLEKLREAVSGAYAELKKLPVKNAVILVPDLPSLLVETVTQALAESLLLSAYEFPYYKSTPEKTAQISAVEMILAKARYRQSAARGIAIAQSLATAVALARDLGNHPANIATPSHLAEHALRIARESKHKIKTKILHQEDIKKERMGGLLAVSRGSDEEPKFIILEYLPRRQAGRGKTKTPTVVLVGKGITFDSGGINIKPSEKMEEMKFDMAGAATVLATIQAAASLKLPLHLVGLIPATENLPSGKATKPGDIITSRSGKTIEVVNTDAEGRLILADALDYAKQYKPSVVIDFATLTGAIVVALGDDLIGAFSNNEKMLARLQAAADLTGEKLWPMPLEPDYEIFIKSDFADLRNIGTIRYGDSIHAANFLKNFVDYPWIHLDIAGVAWATRDKPYRGKGATGTGVRLAIEFLRNYKRS